MIMDIIQIFLDVVIIICISKLKNGGEEDE